jgi:hypothetical protein
MPARPAGSCSATGSQSPALFRLRCCYASLCQLAAAAIGSQFSAAVADDSGAGGLLEDITHKQLSIRHAYLLILLVTLTLTWSTDVNEIIAYASRAFALFYMFQCVVAFLVAWPRKDLSHRLVRLVNFAFLAVVCLLVFALGIPSG